MLSVTKVVSALQRELGSALAQKLQLPGGVAMQPDKVVVSLRFAAQEQSGGDVQFSWCAPAEDSGGLSEQFLHTLTIEFKAGVPGAPAPAAPGPQGIAKPVPESAPQTADQLRASLCKIFGAPGFDSSARATVFREAFAELSAEQAQLVIHSLPGPVPEKDRQAKRSHNLLMKLVRSAPGESPEQGIAILREVFQQNPLDAILALAAREWKTQEDWL